MPDIFDPLRCYLNYAEARGLRSDRLAEARYVRFAASQQRVSVIYNSIKNSQNRFIVFETPISIGISSEDIDLQPRLGPWEGCSLTYKTYSIGNDFAMCKIVSS